MGLITQYSLLCYLLCRIVYKLYIRQASCFSRLGQMEVADRCLSKAREAAGLLSGEERELAERFIAEKSEDMNIQVTSQKEPSVTNNCPIKAL